MIGEVQIIELLILICLSKLHHQFTIQTYAGMMIPRRNWFYSIRRNIFFFKTVTSICYFTKYFIHIWDVYELNDKVLLLKKWKILQILKSFTTSFYFIHLQFLMNFKKKQWTWLVDSHSRKSIFKTQTRVIDK